MSITVWLIFVFVKLVTSFLILCLCFYVWIHYIMLPWPSLYLIAFAHRADFIEPITKPSDSHHQWRLCCQFDLLNWPLTSQQRTTNIRRTYCSKLGSTYSSLGQHYQMANLWPSVCTFQNCLNCHRHERLWNSVINRPEMLFESLLSGVWMAINVMKFN